MKPVRIEKWSDQMLDHAIDMIERRAVRWTRIFDVPVTDFYPKKYSELIIEREFRYV